MEHTIKVKLEGKRPLLMSNGRLVDPQDPITKEIAKLDGLTKARKTDKTIAEADELRWLGSVYANEDEQVVLPAENFEGALRDGARLRKLGKKVQSGVYVHEDAKLKFDDDSKKVKDLVKMPGYTHRKRCDRGVMVTRPIFPKWQAEFTLTYEDNVISKDEVEEALTLAGFTGIGSWKERFGKFSAEIV